MSACLCVYVWLTLDFEGLENGEEGYLDKTKSWSRSIEDLHHTGTQPFCNTLVRSARQSVLRYVSLLQLPCRISLVLPRSANLECCKYLLACQHVVMVLYLVTHLIWTWWVSDSFDLRSRHNVSHTMSTLRDRKWKSLTFVYLPPTSVHMCVFRWEPAVSSSSTCVIFSCHLTPDKQHTETLKDIRHILKHWDGIFLIKPKVLQYLKNKIHIKNNVI